MKIAEVAPPWLAVPPKGYGGIEWVVSLITDGLVERGHDVTLFATGDSSTDARLDYVFAEAPGSGAINSVWHDTVHTAHAFRDIASFDLVHVHPWWSALVTGAACEVPMVHTLHGAFSDHMRQIYAEVGDRGWFVAISEAQRRQMPELRYAGVVYNGIDLDRYPMRPDKDAFVLFLGRTAPEKGMARAIRAARAAGLPLVAAVKSASESERAEWTNMIEPMLGSDVEVLGEISFEHKIDLLSRARAVLFPIDWEEPFGLVMTEAMACGTPVIATPRGSVPEVLRDGETSFVVSLEGYAEEAAACLARVGELDPAAMRADVERRFSKESMVAGYERVFSEVLATS